MFDLRPVRRPVSMVYDPIRAMDEFERRFFREPFPAFEGMSGMFSTDIKEEDNAFVLECDLPGFQKEDLHVDLDGDRLTITAERHSEKEDKDSAGKYLRSERSYGSFTRSFDVSVIDTAGIEAAYTDGVLTLTLPKKPELTPEARRLEIK